MQPATGASRLPHVGSVQRVFFSPGVPAEIISLMLKVFEKVMYR
jgi:hypothetical protein